MTLLKSIHRFQGPLETVDSIPAPLSDGFNTLRSLRSHVTEVSSVMSANVSEEAANMNNQNSTPPPSQQPVSDLMMMDQHEYYNVLQQPAHVMATAGPTMGPGDRPNQQVSCLVLK